MGRGKLKRLALPCLASFWISGPPGYLRPMSLATLSKASPAASSLVWPTNLYCPWFFMRISSVCPPETMRQRAGNEILWRPNQLAYMCPSIWLTPIIFFLQAKANTLAV